jgi:hypothetical protein
MVTGGPRELAMYTGAKSDRPGHGAVMSPLLRSESRAGSIGLKPTRASAHLGQAQSVTSNIFLLFQTCSDL